MKKLIICLIAASLAMGIAPQAAAQSQEDRPERTRPSAAPERDIDDVKQRCISAIDERLQRIDRLQKAVASSEHVTPRHEAILEGQLAEAQAGLARLRAQIRDATDPEELHRLCRSIVEDFRIYVLVTPRTMLTLAADSASAAAAKLGEVAERIQVVIDEAAAEGKDVTQAQAELDSMLAHLAGAETAIDPVADAILPLTPEGWPENGSVLRQASADLKQGRSESRSAKVDAHEALEALRQA